MRVLVTAGGTTDPIDDVRGIGNFSTGRFGTAIAQAFLRRGRHVVYLHAQRAAAPHLIAFDLTADRDCRRRLQESLDTWERWRPLYRADAFDTAASYESQLRRLIAETAPHAIVLAAAVADYVPNPRPGKIRSDAQSLTLALQRTPKVIRSVRDWAPDAYLVGFKLLSGVSEAELIDAARSSLRENRTDLTVANDLTTVREGKHTIHLVRNDEPAITFGPDDDPAERLAEKILLWSGAEERQ